MNGFNTKRMSVRIRVRDLEVFEIEALKRDTNVPTLIRQLAEVIATDNLFTAIFDDGEE